MEIGWIGARERGRSWIWRALPRHIVMWPIDGQKKGNPDVFNDPLVDLGISLEDPGLAR